MYGVVWYGVLRCCVVGIAQLLKVLWPLPLPFGWESAKKVV